MEYFFYDHLPEEAHAIREAVFLQEQGFTEEFDETDKTARHLLLFEKEKPMATARLFEGEEPGVFWVGRVAVLPPFRGRGLGAEMLRLLEGEAKRNGGRKILISAQCQAQPFYEKQGYTAMGPVYLDEHCPHVHMEKTL